MLTYSQHFLMYKVQGKDIIEIRYFFIYKEQKENLSQMVVL